MARSRLACTGVGLAVLMGLLSPAAQPRRPERPIYVLLTVDVETTSTGDIRQDVWGRLPEREPHGIEKIMDILDRHGMRGVFFVNVYEEESRALMAEVCRTIDGRGHDVQLHTHPKSVFGNWGMAQVGRTRQAEILAYGREMIHQWTGRWVVAHRSGSFSADLETVKACRDNGIWLEFSANVMEEASHLGQQLGTLNAPALREGVLCVPMTCHVQASIGSWKSLRMLDIESSSPDEIKRVVRDLRRNGVRAAVLLMHSFSFVRSGEVNERIERALEQVLTDLGQDSDVQVVTARQLYELWRRDPSALLGADCLPTTGWWMTYRRSWQRLGEGYKNAAVALAPVAGLVLSAGMACWRMRVRRQRRAERIV